MTASGTSFASPIVSGVAGLIISANPSLSNSAIVSLLTGTARDFGATGKDILYGAGRVDASNAVASARNIPAPAPDTMPPTTSVTSPVDGSSIAGLRSVNVRVASGDNVGVTRAELYIDGRLAYGGASGSFTYSWSTSRIASGKHTIQSKAYDAAGNSSSSAVMTVTR
jgi:subtilisin family serine protease